MSSKFLIELLAGNSSTTRIVTFPANDEEIATAKEYLNSLY